MEEQETSVDYDDIYRIDNEGPNLEEAKILGIGKAPSSEPVSQSNDSWEEVV